MKEESINTEKNHHLRDKEKNQMKWLGCRVGRRSRSSSF